MSADETPPPPVETPAEASNKSSLDELLDYVRDHLDESPPEDDEIPVLTDIAISAQPVELTQFIPQAQPAENSDSAVIDLSQDLDSVADSVAATDLNDPATSAADDSLNLTQVAFEEELDASSLLIELPDTETPSVELSSIERAPVETTENSSNADQTDWDDDEEFDATQVAFMDDDPVSTQPLAPATENDDHSPVAEYPLEQDEESDLQEPLITATAFESFTTDINAENQQTAESELPAHWLAHLDQIIDERCSALAQELKQQLREPVELTDRSALLDPPE